MKHTGEGRTQLIKQRTHQYEKHTVHKALHTQDYRPIQPHLHHSVTHIPGPSTTVQLRSYSEKSREEVYCKEAEDGDSGVKLKRKEIGIVLHRVMCPKTHSNGFQKKKKTNSKGRGVPAHYTRVIIGPNPHVIGIIPRDRSQYGGPLYALPDHNQGEHPQYTHDDLWCFKYGTDERVQFNNALEHIHDLLLTAEVTRFHEASRLFFMLISDLSALSGSKWT